MTQVASLRSWIRSQKKRISRLGLKKIPTLCLAYSWVVVCPCPVRHPPDLGTLQSTWAVYIDPFVMGDQVLGVFSIGISSPWFIMIILVSMANPFTGTRKASSNSVANSCLAAVNHDLGGLIVACVCGEKEKRGRRTMDVEK
jgi:hypothetical protein